MKRFLTISSAVALTAILFAGQASAAIVAPVVLGTTNADLDAVNLLPPAASPLVDIRAIGLGGQTSGVFTNQISGTAGVTGGIRTIFVGQISNATDGTQFNSVAGPGGGILIGFAALTGTLTSPGTVKFTDGKFGVFEGATTYDARNPSSWGWPGAAKGLFEMTTAPAVVTGPLAGGPSPPGGATAIVPVGAAGQNLSLFDGLTIGDTDFQFLFTEATPGDGEPFLTNYDGFGALPEIRGVFIEGEQDLDQNATGLSMGPGPAFTLDGTDLGILNSMAAAGMLSDLGAPASMTGFATALGASSVMSTDFFADPGGLAGGTGSGDLRATTAETNLYPVITNIPEPHAFLVWGGLAAMGAFYVRRRRIAS